MLFPFPVREDTPLYLAPMAGVSESPFRRLCRRFGADVVVTEFLSAEGIRRENAATLDKLRFGPDERPIGVQIFGADPAAILKKYGSRIKLMHVKDLRKGVKGDFTGSTSQENDVAVGTGQLNIPEIMKAAKRSAISNYYIEDESSSVNVQVPKTLAYLKKL